MLKKIYGRFPLENTPCCARTHSLYSHVYVQRDLSTIKQLAALPSCTIHRVSDSAVGQHLRGSGLDEKRNFVHGFSFLFLYSARGKEKEREREGTAAESGASKHTKNYSNSFSLLFPSFALHSSPLSASQQM